MATGNKQVDLSCPLCGVTIHVAEKHLGREARCPGCTSKIVLAMPNQPQPSKVAIPSIDKWSQKQIDAAPRIGKDLLTISSVATALMLLVCVVGASRNGNSFSIAMFVGVGIFSVVNYMLFRFIIAVGLSIVSMARK